jgi:hypothetical protein
MLRPLHHLQQHGMVLLPRSHERALARNLVVEVCGQRAPELVDALALKAGKLRFDQFRLRVKVCVGVPRAALGLSSVSM